MSPESRALSAVDLTSSRRDGSGSPPQGTGAKRARPARLARSRPRGPVLWVVLVVVALAAIGITGMALTSSGGQPTSSSSSHQNLGLPARSAEGNFTTVGASGQVPPDVLSAISVPRTAVVVGRVDYARGVAAFDAAIQFRTPATYNQVVSFFKAELTADGWSLKSQGPATSAPGEELLAWRAGSDGNYWEIGAVVSLPPSAAAFSQGGEQASVGGPTRFELRLFQVPQSQ